MNELGRNAKSTVRSRTSNSSFCLNLSNRENGPINTTSRATVATLKLASIAVTGTEDIHRKNVLPRKKRIDTKMKSFFFLDQLMIWELSYF